MKRVTAKLWIFLIIIAFFGGIATLFLYIKYTQKHPDQFPETNASDTLIKGLSPENFVTKNVSQWTNDAGYLKEVSFYSIENGPNVYMDYRPNNTQCTQGQTLAYDKTNSRWECATITATGTTPPQWGTLTGSLSAQNDLSQALNQKLDKTTTFGGDISGTADSISIRNDSHYHTGATINSLTSANFVSRNISQWTNDTGYLTSVTAAQITNGSGIYFDYRPNNTQCSNGQVLTYDQPNSRWICGNGGTGGNAIWGSITGDITQQNDLSVALANKLTINTIFGGDVSGTYGNIAISNDSHSHTGATISGLAASNFTSQNVSQWTNDAGYLTTETDPSLAAWAGSTNITQVGTITTGTWHGTPVSTEYILDHTITFSDIAQNGCTDGQIIKWSAAQNNWVCGDEAAASGASGGVIAAVKTVQTRTIDSYLALSSGDGTPITPLDITITPKKAGNKIILQWVISGEADENTVFIVTRNGVKLPNVTDGSNNIWAGIATVPYDPDRDSTPSISTIRIIDDNSLAVASTYQILVRASGSSSHNFYLNRTISSAGQTYYETSLSTGTAMEIDPTATGGSSGGGGTWGAITGTLSDQTDLNDALTGKLSSSALFSGDVSGTYSNIQVANDSHTHTGTTISALTAANFTSQNVSQWTNDAGYITGLDVSQLTNGTNKYLKYKPNNVACTNNQVLKYDATNDRWICGDDNTGGGSGTGGTAIQFQQASGVADVSTTSTSFVDMPDMSVTMTTSGNPVEVNFSTGSGITGGSAASYRILIDGVQVGGQEYVYDRMGAHLTWIESLAAGSHTFKAQWKVTGNTLFNRPTTNFEHRIITVKEFQQAAASSTGSTVHLAQSYGTTDASTNTVGWVDMPDMSVTLTTTGNPIEIAFSASVGNNTTNGLGRFRMLLDGVQVGTLTKVRVPTITVGSGTNLIWSATPAAGTHTAKIQWYAEVGTVYNRAASENEHRTLIMKEYVGSGGSGGSTAANWGSITGNLSDQADLNTALTNKLSTSALFSGDVSGTYNNLAVSDDSHNHTGATISGLSASNFTSQNVSQWTNDAGYVTGLDVSQISNGSGKYFNYKPNNVACNDGQVLKYNTANTRWECADYGDVAINNYYAQLERSTSQTFAANAWTAISFDRIPLTSGFTYTGTDITFPSVGTYEVSVGWRPGGGGDVWGQVRLYGDGASRGHSNSFGQINGNDPTEASASFLVSITNTTVPYQVQFGRLGSTMSTGTPTDINGEPAASIIVTIKRVVGPGNGSGSGTWGSITGNLADQTDLNTALTGKLSSSALFGGDVSGTYSNIQVANDSHSHTGTTISGLSASNFTSTNVSQWTNDAGYISGVDFSQISNGVDKYLNYKPNNVACNNGQTLVYDTTNSRWICGDMASGSSGGASGEMLVIAQNVQAAASQQALNKNISFTTTGTGPYLLYVQTTAFVTGGGLVTVTAKIDGTTVGTVDQFFNTTGSHHSVSPIIVKLTSLSAGAHTLNLTATGAGVQVDFNDRIEAYLLSGGSSSGGGTWGSITGNLSDQTDLNDALTGKLSISSLFGGDVSGTYNNLSVTNDSHSHTGATISGLSTSNFTSPNVSQWTNDAGYLTGVDFSQITNGTGKYLNYKPNNTACTEGQVLKYDATNSRWTCGDDLTGGSGTGGGVVAAVKTIQTRDATNIPFTQAGNGVVITPLNIVMTPKKAGNKIILRWVINYESDYNIVFLVARNGELLPNTTDASNNVYAGTASGVYDQNVASTPTQAVVEIIDEDSLATETTYSVMVRMSGTGSSSFYLNRTAGSTGAGAYETLLSTGIATEIDPTATGGGSSGSSSWGAITGNLSDQTDLNTALTGKLSSSALFGGDVSGTYSNLQVANDSHSHTGATISDLSVSNFTSQNVSQWTNDAGYLTNVTFGQVGNAAGQYLTYKPNNVACTDGQVLKYDAPNSRWICGDVTGGSTGSGSTLPIAYQQASGTTDVNTSSRTWVDMPDMAITLTTTGNPIEILFTAGVGQNTGGGTAGFRMLLDGVQVGTPTYVRVPVTTIGGVASLNWIATPATGSHTVTIQWLAETGTAYNRAASAVEHRTLSVKEFLGISSGSLSISVGSMTGSTLFADASANNQWLGLGASAGRIEFKDAATDTINILDAHVGIGTSTPGYTLDVNGSVNASSLCIAGDCRSAWPTGGTSNGSGNGEVTYIHMSGDQNITTTTVDVTGLTITAQLKTGHRYAWRFIGDGAKINTGTVIIYLTDENNNVLHEIWGSNWNDFSHQTQLEYRESGAGSTVTRKIRARSNTDYFTLWGSKTTFVLDDVTNTTAGSLDIGGVISNSTPGSIFFSGTGSTFAQNSSQLFWNNTNFRLGIGTNNPQHTLDVYGNLGITGSGYINFGPTDGDLGYGIRDHNGTIEVKNNGGSWAPVSTGSSSSVPSWQINPDQPPASPNAMDDEFNGTSVDSKWTVLTDTGSTYSVTEANNLLELKYTSNAPQTYRAIAVLQTAPSGTWKVRTKMNFEGLIWNHVAGGIIIRNENTSKHLVYGLMKHTSYGDGLTGLAMHFTNFSLSGETDLANYWSQTAYIEVEYDGTNVIYRMSTTGLSYQEVYRETAAAYLGGAPTQVGVLLHPYNTLTNSFYPTVTFDWFRRLQ